MLDNLRAMPNYKNQIKHVEIFPPKEAIYSELTPARDPRARAVREAIRKILKVEQFYRHQALGIEAIRAGREGGVFSRVEACLVGELTADS